MVADPISHTKRLVDETHSTVILKGPTTIISDPSHHFYFNVAANSALAKAGSGDLLAGMITGLLGQGYSTIDAALIGVSAHAQAAKKALEKYSEASMIPSFLLDEL